MSADSNLEPPSSPAARIDNRVAHVEISVEGHDTMRWWSWLSLVGLAAAGVKPLDPRS